MNKEILKWITDRKYCHDVFYLLEPINATVGVINKNIDREGVLFAYGLILDEFLKYKNDYPYKTILDYFKYKLEDPYLANYLKECEFSVSEDNTLKDKEGKWEVLCAIYFEKDNIVLYCNGSLIWIDDLKNGKKYIYYAD